MIYNQLQILVHAGAARKAAPGKNAGGPARKTGGKNPSPKKGPAKNAPKNVGPKNGQGQVIVN